MCGGGDTIADEIDGLSLEIGILALALKYQQYLRNLAWEDLEGDDLKESLLIQCKSTLEHHSSQGFEEALKEKEKRLDYLFSN